MASDFYCDEVFSGQTEVEKVIETDNVLAYHHTRPFWPVHIVIVPKRHVASLLDADDALLIEVFAVIRRVAAAVKKKHGGARVLTNLGDYQDSKHLHFHVNFGERIRPDGS